MTMVLLPWSLFISVLYGKGSIIEEGIKEMFILLSVFMLLICVADVLGIINLSKKMLFVTYLFFAPHIPLLWFHIWNKYLSSGAGVTTYLSIAALAFATVVFQLYTTLRLHFHSLGKDRTLDLRVNIVYAGKNLIDCGMWGLYLMILWYAVCFFVLPQNPYNELLGHTFSVFPNISNGTKALALMSGEVIYALIFVWLFLINGCLRVFFGSRNLVVGKRLIILLLMWIPIVQLFLAKMMCNAAKDEYLVTVARSKDDAFTKVDEMCKTKYPIIMVHGIGFRDLKYFNYWGRIPEVLIKHGAKIYYGHQNAWGTIESNADEIKKIVDQALKENACDKVNIIAHSKGGLDSRYLISSLGYGDKVASLTTINTPHWGSELITVLNKLPDYVYRYIAGQINKPFDIAGDTAPDCYASSKQLDPEVCKLFNEKNPDVEGVYYQSYTSVMKNMFSDVLLWAPYLVMRTQKARYNDGLVNLENAKWGEFKGVIKNKNGRGVSHGDMIDLKREDIRGFDVLRFFYDVVCDLKNNGF